MLTICIVFKMVNLNFVTLPSISRIKLCKVDHMVPLPPHDREHSHDAQMPKLLMPTFRASKRDYSDGIAAWWGLVRTFVRLSGSFLLSTILTGCSLVSAPQISHSTMAIQSDACVRGNRVNRVCVYQQSNAIFLRLTLREGSGFFLLDLVERWNEIAS
jgi:hypothetical protein